MVKSWFHCEGDRKFSKTHTSPPFLPDEVWAGYDGLNDITPHNNLVILMNAKWDGL